MFVQLPRLLLLCQAAAASSKCSNLYVLFACSEVCHAFAQRLVSRRKLLWDQLLSITRMFFSTSVPQFLCHEDIHDYDVCPSFCIQLLMTWLTSEYLTVQCQIVLVVKFWRKRCELFILVVILIPNKMCTELLE